MNNVALTLRADDAEPFLRKAAEDAAKFGAWCDYITKKTGGNPKSTSESTDDAKKRWLQKFLAAKRIVEAFGVEYEQTSEEETMTINYNYVGGKTKVMDVGGIKFGMRTGSQPDYKNPYPYYRGDVHAEACRQAAIRVVRAWRANLCQAKAAA